MERPGRIRQFFGRLPLVSSLFRVVWYWWQKLTGSFRGSEAYWQERYRQGGNSGAGSYGEFARFKADVLNSFVTEHGITSVIEFGCGDGHQLTLVHYPRYLGFDISPAALALCRERFAGDASKQFRLVPEYASHSAELTLSLDVIYHLVEDAVYEPYMQRLFDAAQRFVVVFSSNSNEQPKLQGEHVRHRRFTDWVTRERPAWRLIRHIPNSLPDDIVLREGPPADFFIFAKD